VIDERQLVAGKPLNGTMYQPANVTGRSKAQVAAMQALMLLHRTNDTYQPLAHSGGIVQVAMAPRPPPGFLGRAALAAGGFLTLTSPMWIPKMFGGP
jgi:hypothetical protein